MSLEREIHKLTPFHSAEQAAFLGLVRTSSLLMGEFERFFKRHGLSGATYNVLRILRGAGAHGRQCHEIGEHLVAGVPDVTRLIDRLEKAALVARARCPGDRRVVWVRITPKGQKLLEKIDRPLLDLHAAQLGHMSARKLKDLIELLDEARIPFAAGAERLPAKKPAGGRPAKVAINSSFPVSAAGVAPGTSTSLESIR